MPVSTSPPRQLLAFTFPADANFEGRLSGALQRIESGGALRVLAALFVARAPASGELAAVSLRSESSAGMIGQLVGFRLDDQERARQTQETLSGQWGDEVRALAESLQPGSALAAVLLEHSWAQVLGDAVAGIGGRPLADERIEAPEPQEAWRALHRALAGSAG